jgi:4-amino-4-deoxy-L-arabinose transferase-like glycosyltransferase
LYLMYAAIGLGALTKGPVALLFPALTIGTWLLLERRLGDIRRLSLLPGTVIVLAIVVPWWALIQAQHGWAPLQAFWVGENVGRYTEAMQPGERDILFYIPVILGDLFPWTPFAIVGLAWGATMLWRRESPVARLLILWVIWHAGVFSLSQTKQDLYVFPVVPAMAALAAGPLASGLQHSRGWVGWAAVMCAVLMAAIGGGVFWLFGARVEVHQIAGANLLGAVLVTGAAAAVVSAWGARHRAVFAITAATMVAGNYVFALVSLPAAEAYKPVLPIVRVIESRTRPGDPLPVVAHYRHVLPSMTYYLNRPVEHIFEMPALTARAHEADGMFILMRPADFADFQGHMARTTVPVCVVSRHTLFEPKLRNVVEGQSWPETYLAGTGRACEP